MRVPPDRSNFDLPPRNRPGMNDKAVRDLNADRAWANARPVTDDRLPPKVLTRAFGHTVYCDAPIRHFAETEEL